MRLAALVAATPLVPVVDPDKAYAAAAANPVGWAAINAELVTVTPTSAVFTWYTGVPGRTGDALQPAPQDSELLLGSSPTALRTVHHSSRATPYHYVEVHGLEPGRTYFWQARSAGRPAAPAATFAGNPVGTSSLGSAAVQDAGTPFFFTTPQPPPGRHLLTVALANDMHIGETVAGLATSLPGVGGVPPGFSQVAGKPPYPIVMGKAMVAEAAERGADLLLVAGDISAEAEPADLHTAKHLLDRFGRYKRDYFVARGNHDRPHQGAAYRTCRRARLDHSYNDCFVDVFADDTTTWFSAVRHGLHIVGLDTYDKIGNGGDNGALSAKQWEFVTESLRAHKDRPTIVLGHHPVTAESDVVNDEPVRFDLNLGQSNQLQQLYAKTPGVFFHHAGHTHRNKRTRSTTAGDVTFLEVGATKEYPGGFTLLRLHEGGYAVNFYKTRSELAREWSERTRAEYGGLAPLYTAGTVADRNFVVRRDLSGLRRD